MYCLFLALSVHLPQHHLKKQAVSERIQLSASSNSNYILNTSCSSNRSITKERSPGNSIDGVYGVCDDIGDLNTSIGAENISVGRYCSKETSGSDMGGVELGSPPSSSPGAELQEDPEELNGKEGVQLSSRMSHTDCPSTSSVISSYLDSTLSQLPAYFSTNGKSKNRNAVKCDVHVGLFSVC